MKSPNSELPSREERVAAALRENLLKRKEQMRQRDTNESKTPKE